MFNPVTYIPIFSSFQLAVYPVGRSTDRSLFTGIIAYNYKVFCPISPKFGAYICVQSPYSLIFLFFFLHKHKNHSNSRMHTSIKLKFGTRVVFFKYRDDRSGCRGAFICKVELCAVTARIHPCNYVFHVHFDCFN